MNAGTTKLLKKLNSANDARTKLTAAINKIDANDPAFLQNLKQKYTEANTGFDKIFKPLLKITGILGATLDLFEFFAGKDPASQSATVPTVTYQVMDLTGTMDIQQLLAGFSLKVPGALKLPSDTRDYYYDCPIGAFNLAISPKINRTTSYERIACPGQSVIYQNPQPVVSGYTGKYVKYNISENFSAAFQQVPGLQLTDIKFAVLCKPMLNNAGQPYYKITDPYIATHRFAFITGQTMDKSLENPIYHALLNGRLEVHKFDEENNEVYYGSQYVDKNCLKEFSIEVPEATEIYLGVIAVYKISGDDEPIIFYGKYAFDVVNTVQAVNERRCGYETSSEQGNHPYSNYYNMPFTTSLNSDPNAAQYYMYEINLIPGFHGVADFNAVAIENTNALAI